MNFQPNNIVNKNKIKKQNKIIIIITKPKGKQIETIERSEHEIFQMLIPFYDTFSFVVFLWFFFFLFIWMSSHTCSNIALAYHIV